ncbi:hypothetical protein [Methylomonas fluvii]|nr:hypothetical protein [Methylomonas fluvii]
MILYASATTDNALKSLDKIDGCGMRHYAASEFVGFRPVGFTVQGVQARGDWLKCPVLSWYAHRYRVFYGRTTDVIMFSQRYFRAFVFVGRRMRGGAWLSRFEKIWLLPDWFFLGMSRFLILFVPFRRLAALLGAPGGLEPSVPLLQTRDEAVALSIAKVVRIAARHKPW